MAADLDVLFAQLKPVLAKFQKSLAVKIDTPTEYTLVTKKASPFPQHKGQPMFFGSVRVGKAYVSYHLMPIYMSPELNRAIAPNLKKRMQGKSCFGFKAGLSPDTVVELAQLTEASLKQWNERKWI
jgi:hypothetical protein